MAENVQVDAQYTLSRVMKPFGGFERVYQGQTATIPLGFFPVNPLTKEIETRDPQAGKDGYSSDLLRFLPVPVGSEIVLWIPHTYTINPDTDALVEQRYEYTVHFRWRTPADNDQSFAESGQARPFHLLTAEGRPGVLGERRIFLPSATRSVIVEQPEVSGAAVQVQNLRRESFVPQLQVAGQNGLPLLPDGNEGVLQQGVLDPLQFVANAAGLAMANASGYIPARVYCEADEMLITAVREDPSTPANWEFEAADGADAPLSNLFGSNVNGAPQPNLPVLGILVFTGS